MPAARRPVPARHERLMDLVARGVEHAEPECRPSATGRTDEERAEDCVLGCVRDLAKHQVPAAEPGAEVRNGGEEEDHRRPDEDGKPVSDE